MKTIRGLALQKHSCSGEKEEDYTDGDNNNKRVKDHERSVMRVESIPKECQSRSNVLDS